MLITEHSVETSAPEAALWALMQPESWHLWRPKVRQVHYRGLLAAGKNGKILGLKGASRFKTREVTPNSFTIWRRPLPNVRLRFIHILEENSIRFRVEMNGLFAPIAARFYRKRMNKVIPQELNALREAAEAERLIDQN